MFYEIIYETGNHSIAYYDSDEEARSAVSEHHKRALRGLPASTSEPRMGPAERVVKVLKYDDHPVEFNASQAVDANDVLKTVQETVNSKGAGGMVSVNEVAAAVRDLSDPGVDSDPHESNYKMPEVGELTGWENA